MTAHSIMFSNIGYAKGFDGSLWKHMAYFHRHLYCSVPLQISVLSQLKMLIETEKPDICCFVEIDQGAMHTGKLDQIQKLVDEAYPFYDIANKYGPQNPLRHLPLHVTKSNGFMARKPVPFERIYFSHGSKRLLYKLVLECGIHIYFAHFSLNKMIRIKQFYELNKLIRSTHHPVIVLADFNIFDGFSELGTLQNETDLVILSKEDEPTFTFHNRKLALDLCLCSRALASRIRLKIVPQPFSDHAALLIDIE